MIYNYNVRKWDSVCKGMLKAGLLNVSSTRLHSTHKCSTSLQLVLVPRSREFYPCLSNTCLCIQDFPGSQGEVSQQLAARTDMTWTLSCLIIRTGFLTKVFISIRSLMNGNRLVSCHWPSLSLRLFNLTLQNVNVSKWDWKLLHLGNLIYPCTVRVTQCTQWACEVMLICRGTAQEVMDLCLAHKQSKANSQNIALQIVFQFLMAIVSLL